jgi:putative membrane-bound dehydrogenase-like protein
MAIRPLAAILLLAGCAGPGTPRGAAIRAGVARADITPEESIRLSGYAARSKPSEGVEQRLFARAFAFEDADGRRALIVCADAIATAAPLTGEIAAKVKAATGVPRERFALCTSHDHSAPAMTGVIANIIDPTPDERAAIERYTRLFVERVTKVSEDAVRDLAPAALGLGWTAAGFAGNRRTPGGPVDQDVPVLRIATPEGKVRAVLYGYACHCTTLDFNRVCGDWAGYASEGLEQDLPGVTAGCVIGCGADANPMPRRTLDLARRHGRELADAVAARVKAGPFRPVTGAIDGKFALVDLPFDKLPTRDELQQSLEKGRAEEKRRARMLLDGGVPAAVPYPVQSLSLGGDLTFVILGGEVVVDYALRLKREFDPARVWPVAYSNDVLGYIPSERILAEGGYEGGGAMVWYGQPAKFAPGVEDVIFKQIRASVPETLRRPEKGDFQIEPGFEIDLVAAEPHLRDPIHVSWDARGRAYVTEMIDYPEGPPAGRVVRLEDADGDGRYEKSTVFVPKLAYPTSAAPWRKGVLVLCAPELLYFEDSDGDGVADLRRVLFDGFAEGNTQHRVNSLQWGLDNWIYGGNGDSAATVRSVEHPERKPVTMTFADFRFKPDTGEFELLAEHGGYALAFDDWGHRFVSQSGSNRRHVVLDRALRDRNPFVPSIQNALAFEGSPKLHTLTKVERFNDPNDFGFFTAASGLSVYRGGLFPAHYQGNTFIGESAGNIVHRDVLVRQGAAWKAAPHTQPQEFLASRDPWFRPVFTATGPDGCLFICDMYRAVIEHPEWIPNDIEKTLNVRAGDDKGRLYRIRHRSAAPRPVENLEALPSGELVKRLESPNGWVRDTAQRLLYERQDKTIVPALASLGSSAVARVHALWTLHGLGALDADLVRARLADPEPGVRETAVRLADPASVLPLAKDPDAAVRLRVAEAIGALDTPEAVTALGDLLFDPASDTWIRSAACLSRPDVSHRVLARVAERIGGKAEESARMIPYVWRLATVVGRRDDAAQIRQALDLLLPKPDGAMADWQAVGFGGGVVSGLGQKYGLPAKRVRELAPPERLARAVEEAARIAEDAKVIDGTRYDALLVLGIDEAGKHRDLLRKYLAPKNPPELQDGAILGTSYLEANEDVARMLLEPWARYAPQQKQGVLDALFWRADRIRVLLDAMEARKVALAELGNGRKEQLRRLSDEALRKRAAALLDADKREDRQKVYEQKRQTVLPLKGRRPEGLALFAKHCSACHPVQGVGPQVGPDLVTVRKRDPAVLLMDIIDPNASVAPNFVAYNVVTTDEVVTNGLVVSQSPAAVTLRIQGGQERTFQRAQIEQLQSNGRSLMPDALETLMTDQELADLIEYLRQIQ